MKNKLIYILLPLFLLISEAGYLCLYSKFLSPITLYAYISVFNSIIFVLIWLVLRKMEFKSWIMIAIIISGIVYRASALPMYPLGSDDIYRYIWDGKVSANGINPFRYAPAAKELKWLHTDLLPAKINHPQMKTIYPPYSQAFFFAAYKLFGENVYAIKILLFISEVITMLLLFLLLKLLKKNQYNIALYALCPLPIFQFMIDGHIDGAGFPFLLLFFLFYLTGKKTKSFIIAGVSIISKFISGIILPFAFKEEDMKNRVYMIIIPLLVIIISYIPFFSGGVFPFESLVEFSSNWVANSSLFAVIFWLVKDNQNARLIVLVVFLFSFIWLFFSKKKFLDKIFFAFFLFFICSPTVHPWYITWLAVLLPLCFWWSGFVFVTLVNLVNILLINYIEKGIWETFSWLHFAEYIPVISIFIYEIFIKENDKTEIQSPVV